MDRFIGKVPKTCRLLDECRTFSAENNSTNIFYLKISNQLLNDLPLTWRITLTPEPQFIVMERINSWLMMSSLVIGNAIAFPLKYSLKYLAGPCNCLPYGAKLSTQVFLDTTPWNRIQQPRLQEMPQYIQQLTYKCIISFLSINRLSATKRYSPCIP